MQVRPLFVDLAITLLYTTWKYKQMLKEKIKVINVRLMLSGFRKDLKCG